MPEILYSTVLRKTKFHPNKPYVKTWRFKYANGKHGINRKVWVYEADTIDGILDQLEADGFIIIDRNKLDSEPLETAYEYVLWCGVMQAQGCDSDEALSSIPDGTK